ncbi:hypothetical protein NBCG_00592 [Nocardioidaceae bacterium Broad-1]|nr:hypothetical protein NBCG_00592 [Nocardioidaceae bacterium Broad-1]
MRSHEAAWVAELLILLPDVEILSVSVNESHVWSDPGAGSGLVDAVRLDILTSPEHVTALVDALGLSEGESTEHGGTRHRHWIGWSADASREVPVWVRVSIVERLASLVPDGMAA